MEALRLLSGSDQHFGVFFLTEQNFLHLFCFLCETNYSTWNEDTDISNKIANKPGISIFRHLCIVRQVEEIFTDVSHVELTCAFPWSTEDFLTLVSRSGIHLSLCVVYYNDCVHWILGERNPRPMWLRTERPLAVCWLRPLVGLKIALRAIRWDPPSQKQWYLLQIPPFFRSYEPMNQ